MTAIAPADHAAYLDWLRAQLDQAIIPLDDAAWNRAAAQDSIDSYRVYLADFPSGRHSGDAKEVSRRLEADKAAWVKAITANCRTGFEGYLAAESNGKYCAEARKLLDQLVQCDQHAWVEAKKHGTLLAYRDYLTAFPEALHREDAYVQAWGIASKRDSLSGYKDYLSWFPQAPSRTLAQQASTRLQRDQTAWDCATNTNTIAAYNAYLETPTAGKFHAKAKAARDHLVSIDETNWQEIDGRLSLRAYRDYLKTFPEALHRTEAIDQAWASAKKTDSASAYRNFVAWFPNASQQALAQQVATALQSDHSAYKTATRQNTIAAFEAYLRTQTEGRFRTEAQAKLDRLVTDDETAWRAAAARLTRWGYRTYLDAQPNGRYVQHASTAIITLDDATWARTSGHQSHESYAAYLYAHPDGRHRDEAIQARDQQLLELQQAYLTRVHSPGRLHLFLRRLHREFIGTRPIYTIPAGEFGVRAVAIDQGGQYAFGANRASIKVWKLGTGEMIHEMKGDYWDWITLVPGDVAGPRALLGTPDKRFRLLDLETGETIQIFSGHSDWVHHCVVSPDGCHALTGSTDTTLRLWDLNAGKTIQVFEGHSESISFITISPDGCHILSIAQNAVHEPIRLWSIATGETVRVFEQGGYVDSVAITPDGRYGFSRIPREGGLHLWDLETGRTLRKFEGDRNWRVSIASNGVYGVSAWNDRNTLQVWNLKSGVEAARLSRFSRWGPGPNRNPGVYRFVISPDGSYVLSANWDNTFSVWPLPKPAAPTRKAQQRRVLRRTTLSPR
ncbi:MAG: WD40 repeat domain-containing protein [Lamprocystis purpurea]|jgi:WD40 repeat protein|uniref:WD40 repeat domain-containing protein n=1 Tax=Lamprocystis purpurea TaxID=61598 RepID=UPI00036F3DCC|nr:WD40 repeat domain-containing protein [Lamprocystis purpurea]MBV5273580.1 WD40 repeat domain-containing protein [Lamprocystis purpurea]